MRHRHVYSDTVKDIDIEYMFEPYSDVLSEKVGDRLIVAYLVHDDDCENPMTSCDAEGRLYTKPERYGGGSITDDSSWGSYLGLTEDGEPDLELYEVKERARELMGATIAKDPDFIDYCLEEFEEFSCIEDCFDTIDFDYDSIPSWMHNRLEGFIERAWDQLDDEGVLRERLAVPVNYCSNNHGPGTASAYTVSIDKCNAVWVPDKEALANFGPTATMADAYKYADGVLENYINWCNGDCYGCVVETFDEQGEQLEEDSCWGFIGSEYAEQSLKEDFFKPALEHILKEQSCLIHS